MTGKELILYILQNNLENEVVIKDGIFIWLMNEEEAAAKFGCWRCNNQSLVYLWNVEWYKNWRSFIFLEKC